MPSLDLRGAAIAEAQAAFLDLLSCPLISARLQVGRWRRAFGHRPQLADWATRLGYRLVANGGVLRLHRDPLPLQPTSAPPGHDPPSRRELVLTALAAVACEQVGEGTTIQQLSDEVRMLSLGQDAGVTPYDPDRYAERSLFLKALARLASLGVLVQRTVDESLRSQWEDHGTGPGGGQEVDREALLLLTDPHTVALAFAPAPADDESAEVHRLTTRSQRLLRTLVEDTALLYADLHPIDADYARSRRSWLASQAEDMTGGRIEIREEGMLLRLPPDNAESQDLVIQVPGLSRLSWLALDLLEAAIREGPEPDADGVVTIGGGEIRRIAARIHTDRAGVLTDRLRDSPNRLRTDAAAYLASVGILRVTEDEGWSLLPTAGRFRDARAVWEPMLLLDAGEDTSGT